MKEVWQLRMDAAFDRYFAMSPLLRDDVESLLKIEEDKPSSRRNFVRAAAALIEGYLACFREMCQVGLDTGPGPLSDKEAKALTDERSFGAADRVKYTVRAAYKLFQLPSHPNFSGSGWTSAQLLIEKRERLMHPKTVEDLEIPDETWNQIHSGTNWMFAQLFDFVGQIAKAHGAK